MNVYYLQVDIPDIYPSTPISHDICLMIAESESSAVSQMNHLLRFYRHTVSIPSGASSWFGHGLDITEYLTDPQNHEKYRELLDLYHNHFKRYELQLFNSKGEILWQNDYTNPLQTHSTYHMTPNVFVTIKPEDIDKLDSGIAFIDDRTEGDSQADILLSQKVTEDSGITIYQTMIKPDGTVQRRQYKDGEWSSWSAYPVHLDIGDVEEGSYKLAYSGSIYSFVKSELVRVYKLAGVINTREEVLSLYDDPAAVNGNVYNYNGIKTTVSQPDGSILNLDTGDNFVVIEEQNYKLFDNLGKVFTFDDTPTEGSTNGVTSGGVYDSLQAQNNKIQQIIDNKVQEFDSHTDEEKYPSALAVVNYVDKFIGDVTLSVDENGILHISKED